MLAQAQAGIWPDDAKALNRIGPGCIELRYRATQGGSWRLIYQARPDEIAVLAVFAKKQQATATRFASQAASRAMHFS